MSEIPTNQEQKIETPKETKTTPTPSSDTNNKIPTPSNVEQNIQLSGLNGGYKATTPNSFDVRSDYDIVVNTMKDKSFISKMERDGKEYIVVGLKINGIRGNTAGRDGYTFATIEDNGNLPSNINELLINKAKENASNIYPNTKDMTFKEIEGEVIKINTPSSDNGSEVAALGSVDVIENAIKSLPKDKIEEIANALHKEEITSLIKEGKIKYIDSVTKVPCLRYGGRGNSFNRGSKWEIVKDLKGYKPHEKGGVDLSIGKNGVEVRSGESKFYAKNGLLFSDGDPIEKRIATTYSEAEASKIKEHEKFLSDFIQSPKYKEMLLKQYDGDGKAADENIKKRLEQLELTKYDNTLLNKKTGEYEKDRFVPYTDSGNHLTAFTAMSEEDKKATKGDVYLPSSAFTSMYDYEAQKNDPTNLGGYPLNANVPAHEMTHRTLGVNDENITPYAKEKIKNIMAGTYKLADDMGNKKGVNPDSDPTGLGAKNIKNESYWQQPTEVLARLNSFRKVLSDNGVYNPNTENIDAEKYTAFKKSLKNRFDILNNIPTRKMTEDERKEFTKIIDIDAGLHYMNDTIFKDQKQENDNKIMWMLNNLVKNENKGEDYNV
jgi:hypothetical protein